MSVFFTPDHAFSPIAAKRLFLWVSVLFCAFFVDLGEGYAQSKDTRQAETSPVFSVPAVEKSEIVSPWIRIPHGKGITHIGYQPGRQKLPAIGPKSFDVDDRKRPYVLDSLQHRLVSVAKDGSIRPLISMPKDALDAVSTEEGLYVLQEQFSQVTRLREKGKPVVYPLPKSCTHLERTKNGVKAVHRHGGFLLAKDGDGLSETPAPSLVAELVKGRIVVHPRERSSEPLAVLDVPVGEIVTSVRLVYGDDAVFWLKLASTPKKGSVLPQFSLLRLERKQGDVRRYLLPPAGEASPSLFLRVAPDDAVYVMNVRETETSMYRLPL